MNVFVRPENILNEVRSMTHLIPDPGNPDSFGFDREEVVALLNGNFRSRKCINCGGTGWEHYNAATGVVMGTGFAHDIDNDIEPCMCEDCNGFGQIVIIGEQ